MRIEAPSTRSAVRAWRRGVVRGLAGELDPVPFRRLNRSRFDSNQFVKALPEKGKAFFFVILRLNTRIEVSRILCCVGIGSLDPNRQKLSDL